jgi:long-chain acyl-CoA synthetase
MYARLALRGTAEFVVRPGGTLRYERFLEDLHGSCGLFDVNGLVPGDRVMVVTADENAAITTFVAALLDGLVPVMLAPDAPAPRIAAIVDKVAPGLIVADGARLAEDWATSAVPVEPHRKGLLGTSAPKSGLHAKRRERQRAPRLPDAPNALAYILFTSGTTSAPKGVMVTHRNLFTHLETLSRVFGYDMDSRIFNGLSLAHADGLVQGPLLALANGCALIRPGPFAVTTMENWLNSVRADGATHFLSVPTVYALIDRHAAHDDYFDAPVFRCLVSSAAKLDEGLWRRLEKRFDRPVFNHYGLTETVASGLYAGPHPDMGPIGTIGKPIDMAVRLVGVDGRDVPEGETGEIWLSGDNVFAGYWADPGVTAEVLTGDGWLRTGDLARKRPDGAYEIQGRLKTVIIYGGLLIRPEELDEALLTHPAVVEAVTVGLPDVDFGEIPVSVVVLNGTLDEAVLTEHCRARLEPMKVPKRIVIVDAIARGDAGKPRLEILRAALGAAASRPAYPRDVIDAVLELASVTFRQPIDSLSPDATPDDLPAWDSFAHISLILLAERRFGVLLPTAEIVAIRTLADLARAVERAQ